MDIKIIVATHKKYWMPEDPVYMPLQVGAEGKPDLGYARDDTGDNISSRNATYCELTGIYWAWKNLRADYIGVVHYRRFFTHKGFFARSIAKKREDILKQHEWEQLLTKADILVPDKRKYYIESNQQHYLHAHPKEQFDVAKAVIEEKYPAYKKGWDIFMERNWAYMFNMFIMKREYFAQFCEWWFGVMFEVERRLDIHDWEPKERRWFIDELLLDVWLETNGYAYQEVNVDFFENQDWFVKGSRFLKRKICN